MCDSNLNPNPNPIVEDFWSSSSWAGFLPPSPLLPLSPLLPSTQGQGEGEFCIDVDVDASDPFWSTLAFPDDNNRMLFSQHTLPPIGSGDDNDRDFAFQWHNSALHSSFPFSFSDYMLRPVTILDDSVLRELVPSPTAPILPKKPAAAATPVVENPAILAENQPLLKLSTNVNQRSGVSLSLITTTGAVEPLARAKRRKKETRKPVGSGGGGREVPGNLKSLLLQCAEAIVSGNRQRGESLLALITQSCSFPLMSAQQRLAYYFGKSLAMRMFGITNPLPRDNMWMVVGDEPSIPSIIECFEQFRMLSPYTRLAHYISCQTIAKVAAEGAAQIHVLELAIPGYNQWPDLIDTLVEMPSGRPPPQLRITSIVFSDIVIFSPTAKVLVERSNERVAAYARSRGVAFKWHVWFGGLEDLRAETVDGRQPGEVLIINSTNCLHVLADETVENPSRRDAYLRFLRGLEPRIFIQSEVCATFGTPFFLTRFRETLSYFESYFDMMECAVNANETEERVNAVSGFLGTIIQNTVGFEGTLRVARPQRCKQWRWKVEAAGFEQVPLDLLIKEKAKAMLRRMHKHFWVGEEDNWLVMGWKGCLAHAITTWKPTQLDPLGLSSRRPKKVKTLI